MFKVFSPSSWRKKRVTLFSDPDARTPDHQRAPSSSQSLEDSKDASWGSSSVHKYSPSHARSVVSLGSPKFRREQSDISSPSTRVGSPRSSLKSGLLDFDPTDPQSTVRPTRRRPSRPPSLDLNDPPPPSTLPHSTTSPTRTKTPSEAGKRSRSKPHLQSLRLPSSAKSARGTLPELDGVWKGFLEEVNEDARSLREVRPRNQSTNSHSRHRSATVGQRSKRFQDLPPSPPYDARHFEQVSLSPRADQDDSSAWGISLSMFPEPPPLNIRKKRATSRPSESRIRPPSPSSCDSTPLATPTTPTPFSSSPSSPKKLVTSNPSSDTHSFLAHPPVQPHSKRSFTSDSIPQTELRSTRSLHNLRVKQPRRPPLYHRVTASDSVSSSNSSEDECQNSRSYLRSMGRTPTQSSYTTAQWGVAV